MASPGYLWIEGDFLKYGDASGVIRTIDADFVPCVSDKLVDNTLVQALFYSGNKGYFDATEDVALVVGNETYDYFYVDGAAQGVVYSNNRDKDCSLFDSALDSEVNPMNNVNHDNLIQTGYNTYHDTVLETGDRNAAQENAKAINESGNCPIHCGTENTGEDTTQYSGAHTNEDLEDKTSAHPGDNVTYDGALLSGDKDIYCASANPNLLVGYHLTHMNSENPGLMSANEANYRLSELGVEHAGHNTDELSGQFNSAHPGDNSIDNLNVRLIVCNEHYSLEYPSDLWNN